MAEREGELVDSRLVTPQEFDPQEVERVRRLLWGDGVYETERVRYLLFGGPSPFAPDSPAGVAEISVFQETPAQPAGKTPRFTPHIQNGGRILKSTP